MLRIVVLFWIIEHVYFQTMGSTQNKVWKFSTYAAPNFVWFVGRMI
jgi:hypothetical protein